MPEFITVKAPEGRMTPINPSDAADPSGVVLRVTSEQVTRVRYSQDVRRSIARGDLYPCTLAGEPCDLEKANSPKAMHVGSHATDEDLFEAGIKKRPPAPKPEAEAKAPIATTDASKAPAFDLSDREGKR